MDWYSVAVVFMVSLVASSVTEIDLNLSSLDPTVIVIVISAKIA